MGLAHEKKSYLQEKANLFEIGSYEYRCSADRALDQRNFNGLLSHFESLLSD